MNIFPTTDTILLVEDDASIGEVLLHVLKNETSYHAVLATNSVEALQLIHHIKPCLFLLDYHLPGMNGLDLYDCLHAMEGLKTIPALFMSANIPLREAEKRHIPVLHKPFDLDDLVQTIEKLLL